MPRHVAIVLAMVLTVPALAGAEERILESAERLARETALQAAPEFRRSPTRTTIGIAMAAAGVAMMLIEPKQPTQPVQPTQPSQVPVGILLDEARDLPDGFFEAPAAELITVYPLCGFLVEPCALGLVVGARHGADAGVAAATAGDRTVYEGEFKPFIPFIPYEKPNAGLRYGGAALAVAGAAVAALWSSVPVMRDVSVSPTRGGVAVGSRIGF